MRILLDTCEFLWLVTGDAKLSMAAVSAVRDPQNQVFLSAVSFWEISLKHSLGKLPLPQPPAQFVPLQREKHLIAPLASDEAAVGQLSGLPLLHRDPFDRMLICQALAHGLTFASSDSLARQYAVALLVLSAFFFSKKWPRAELDGLFALETTSRKVILPVWKDVSEDEVRKYSPVLAGRYAAKASDGVDSIVAQIKQAVQAADRAREISSLDAAMSRIKKLDQTLKEKADSETFLATPKGAVAVEQQFAALRQALESTVLTLNSSATALALKLHITQQGFFIRCSNALDLHFRTKDLYINSASDCSLLIDLSCPQFDDAGNWESARKLTAFEFKPVLRNSGLIWANTTGMQLFGNDDLVAYLLDVVVDGFERLNNRR